MSLITPDFGLLVWMTLIFLIVFAILAIFGFPMITGMVDKRSERINESIAKAKEAEQRLSALTEEQKKLIDEARVEQNRILREAAASRDEIIQKAKQQAGQEAEKMLAKARTEIAAERESAIRQIRSQVAEISLGIAEKVLRKDMEEEGARKDLLDRYVDEASRIDLK